LFDQVETNETRRACDKGQHGSILHAIDACESVAGEKSLKQRLDLKQSTILRSALARY
jgi:hypothetical protein